MNKKTRSTSEKETDRSIDTGKATIRKSPVRKKTGINKNIMNIVYVAMFTALIAVCSQVYLPLPAGMPPVTLQTLAVFLAGGMLGWLRGTLSVFVYILLGLIGVPVFSGFSGGPAALFGMTGGYIIGFIFTAFIVGIMCEKLGRKLWVCIVSMIAGLLVCYAFGTFWFMFIYSQTVRAIDFIGALGLCVFPFLLFDAGKIAVSSILINRLDKVIRL